MNALTRPRLRVSALRLAVLPAWLMTCLLSPAQQAALKPEKPSSGPRHAVVPDKELLITSKAVTESPETRYPGPLSFGYLMEQMAGKTRASVFTHDWLRLWLRDQEVNRDIAPARPGMEAVLEVWRRKDQEGSPDDPLGWTPNLANAPFKLIAVVNRMDLVAPAVVEQIRASQESAARQLAFLRGETFALAVPVKNKLFTELGEIFHRTSPELGPGRLQPFGIQFPVGGSVQVATVTPQTEFVAGVDTTGSDGFSGGSGGYGSSGSPFLAGSSSGEGRLVFAFTDAAGQPVEPGFNVIFEYKLMGPGQRADAPPPPRDTPPPVLSWAHKWHSLGNHEAFDADYVRDLVALTKGFTDQRPPRNSDELWSPPTVGQIRTNDGVLDAVREFREFRFVPGTQPIDTAAPSLMPRIRQVPVAQTPAEQYQEGKSERVLAMVLKTRVENFRKEAPVDLPTSILMAGETEPDGLLGARSLLPATPLDFSWKVSGLNEKSLVRKFSLQTCNGCHGGDTRCDNGFHLKAGPNGTLASAFLALPQDSPAHSEMRDRSAILKALLEAGERDSNNALIRLLHRRHRTSH